MHASSSDIDEAFDNYFIPVFPAVYGEIINALPADEVANISTVLRGVEFFGYLKSMGDVANSIDAGDNKETAIETASTLAKAREVVQKNEAVIANAAELLNNLLRKVKAGIQIAEGGIATENYTIAAGLEYYWNNTYVEYDALGSKRKDVDDAFAKLKELIELGKRKQQASLPPPPRSMPFPKRRPSSCIKSLLMLTVVAASHNSQGCWPATGKVAMALTCVMWKSTLPIRFGCLNASNTASVALRCNRVTVAQCGTPTLFKSPVKTVANG